MNSENSSGGAPPLIDTETWLTLQAVGDVLASAAEAERRRLVAQLQRSIIEPINLLLAQANVYEQTLTEQSARMAVAVLSSLARQVLQQARDLEESLDPAVVEALGLEPALELLALRTGRMSGLRLELVMPRLQKRLPLALELALFRLAQDALERAIHHARAHHMTIRLEWKARTLILRLEDDGLRESGMDLLLPISRRIGRLGGVLTRETNAHGGLALTVHFSVVTPALFTQREVDVLRLLADGLSNKQIATALAISPRTINFHLDNIYAKLGVGSRTEAVIYALRHDLVGGHAPGPVQITGRLQQESLEG